MAAIAAAAAGVASNAADPIIRLRGVTKVYGTGVTAFQALQGVDLDITGIRGQSPRPADLGS